jgi:Ca2+-transporting ATPase
MFENIYGVEGLSAEQVLESRKNYGLNLLASKKRNRFLEIIIGFVKEPMVIMLLIAATLYFITGNIDDGIFLSGAIIIVAGISLYQDNRSKQALDNLKKISQPKSKVIRDGKIWEINSMELVVGDFLMVEEGSVISADAQIMQSNDFFTNESLITGESLPVYKDKDGNNLIYNGTVVTSGLAICEITHVGNETQLGKIGASLENISKSKTPLEIQINDFVKKMVFVGVLVFIIVWAINYAKSSDMLDSLLNALTLAMSILPEEIPVAFTTFMALGAWRLMKKGIVVKDMKTVETLGSATVICTDKTGTITENKMALAKIFTLRENKISDPDNLSGEGKKLIEIAMWSSEPIPFDPMEKALHESYSANIETDQRPNYNLSHEYPLGGVPPMMTHVFSNAKGDQVIAMKGAVQAILKNANLSKKEKLKVEKVVEELGAKGYRLLGVGEADFQGNKYPETQQEFKVNFIGLVAFYDPPKKNIKSIFQEFKNAGLDIKIVTGDTVSTTHAIAKQIQFEGASKHISGKNLIGLSNEELQNKVMEKKLFTRMFPDAKLKIINALKQRKEVVAMIGDGVNDGPALKAANIGIAMGKKGTEIAKQAASLILVEDDISKMLEAIAAGRKIYTNLKKAIQYIISIHIPIILTVFIPLVLGWVYPNIFSPVHIIILELIMGPTCSIIYENEPIEKHVMQAPPRPFTTSFLKGKELFTSVIQGLMITVGIFFIYQFSIFNGFNENVTRTMVFLTLIASNIFLTLINRSFYFSFLTTFKYKNPLIPMIVLVTTLLTISMIFINPMANLFEFNPLSLKQIGICIFAGFIFTSWYELVKWNKRMRSKRADTSN